MRFKPFGWLKLALNKLNVMFMFLIYVFTYALLTFCRLVFSCVKVGGTAGISFLPYKKVKRLQRCCISLIYRAVVWPVNTSPTHREHWQCNCWKGPAPLVGIRATKTAVTLFEPLGLSKTQTAYSCPPKQIIVTAPFSADALGCILSCSPCLLVGESSHLICLRQQQSKAGCSRWNLWWEPLPLTDNNVKH